MKIEVEVIDNVIQPTYVELKNGKYEVEINNIDLRTASQNRSQWLWFSQIATMLNNQNITTEQILKPDMEWNKDKVKSLFFDPIIDFLYDKKTSTKLNKTEYTKIIDTMTKAFGHRGVTLPPFPNREMIE